MAVTIKLKNSVTQDAVPTTSHLPAVGELALNANINSLGIYMRASDNSIVKMAGPGSVSTVAASTTVAGISEYATNAETTAGSSSTRTVTPAGLNAVTVAERSTSNSTYLALAGGTLTGVLAATAGSNSAASIHFGDTDSGLFGGTNTVSLTAGGTTRLTADTGVSVVGTLAVTGAITSTSDITLADKLIHSGDTNTAIRFPAADTFSVETGGAEALRVDSSQRLLIGTSTNLQSQTQRVQIAGTDADSAIILSRFSANNVASYLLFQKSRNATVGGNTIVQDDDLLGRIYFQGNDGTGNQSAAYIEAFVDGTPGTTDMPGRLVFSTSLDGTVGPIARLTIDNAGVVNVPDNGKFTAGASNDLSLFHDGSDSWITHDNGGNGSLVIKSTTVAGSPYGLYLDSDFTGLRNEAQNEYYLKATNGAAVQLYHNNFKSFQTDSDGIVVYAPEGNSANVYLYADEGDDNADKWRLQASNNGNLYIENKTSGAWEKSIHAEGNGLTALYYDNSKKFETHTDGIHVTGDVSITGNYLADDNEKLKMGDGADLQIFHNGTKNWIEGHNGDVGIAVVSGGEHSANFKANSGVDLYYDNSKKFETLNNGVKSHGRVQVLDGNSFVAGDGDDFRLLHNGTNSFIINDTGELQFQANDVRFYTSGASETHAKFINNGAVELYHNNIKTFSTDGNGIFALGPEGGNANVYIYADEGDDDADKWSITASAGGSELSINNRLSGAFETSIECNGNGNVELYYDNSKKLETSANGIKVYDRIGVNITPTTALQFLDHSGSYEGRASWGNSADLQIYHDGHSRIKTASDAAGNLVIDSNNDINLRVNNSEMAVHCHENAAVELYYDNSKKFETVATGCELPDDSKLYLGDGGDLALHHDGSNSYIANTTGELYISASQVNIKSAAGEYMAYFNDNGEAALYYDDVKTFNTASSGIELRGPEGGNCELYMYADEGDDNADLWKFVADVNGGFSVQNKTSGSWENSITAIGNGATDLYYDNAKKFETSSTGVTIHGNLKLTGGTGTDLEIHTDNAAGIVYKADENGHKFQSWTGSAWETAAHFQDNLRVKMPEVYSTSGSSMRDVQIESNGTLCGQSSIRAAKTNIAEITDVNWIYDLKPVSFNFRKKTVNDDGTNTYLDEAETEKAHGLIAEEVEAVNQDFCFYDKDKDGKDVLAGVYYKTLISPLIKVVQEQKKEIDTLKTKVAALGG